MKEKDRFILDIKRLGINGEGIGFYNKLAVFVNNAIPGEGIEVEVDEVYPKMAIAHPILWKKESPYRVKVACPYYEKCGACQVMHIDNNKMKDYKRDMVIEAINRYTKLNPKSFEIRETINMENPYSYRNKSTGYLRKNNAKIKICMFEEGSNKYIPIDNCLVLDEKINEINNSILALADKLKIKAYPEDGYSLRHLITRVSKATRESQACLVVYEYNSEIKKLVEAILDKKIVDSLYINVNEVRKTREIFGEKLIHVGGKVSIVEKIDKYKFNILPTTFFQLNTKQTNILYDKIKKVAKLSHKEVVLDAYCGVGSIGIYLSNLAKEVYGIEYSKDSIISAKENAKNNKINNINFYQGDVKKLLPELIKKGINFDTCVFDPPRGGLDDDIINLILKNKFKRIVYVSCNPSSFAKDLDKLSKIYKVSSIDIVDMFPQTSRVEIVCALNLKE